MTYIRGLRIRSLTSSHDVDLVLPDYSSFSIERVDLKINNMYVDSLHENMNQYIYTAFYILMQELYEYFHSSQCRIRFLVVNCMSGICTTMQATLDIMPLASRSIYSGCIACHRKLLISIDISCRSHQETYCAIHRTTGEYWLLVVYFTHQFELLDSKNINFLSSIPLCKKYRI